MYSITPPCLQYLSSPLPFFRSQKRCLEAELRVLLSKDEEPARALSRSPIATEKKQSFSSRSRRPSLSVVLDDNDTITPNACMVRSVFASKKPADITVTEARHDVMRFCCMLRFLAEKKNIMETTNRKLRIHSLSINRATDGTYGNTLFVLVPLCLCCCFCVWLESQGMPEENET